jgi:formylglycine-generating enzyme required for sulfatase activity
MTKRETKPAGQKLQTQQIVIIVITMVLIFAAGILLGQAYFGDNDEEDGPIARYFTDLTGQRHSQNTDWQVVGQEFDSVPMVLVPSGCFAMGNDSGSDDEKPVHEICFDDPFWLDTYEVSNAQFAEFVGLAEEASVYPEADLPRNNLTWQEAYAYCQKRGGRLPTEAEWEFVLRGPSGWNYPWGDDFNSEAAVFVENGNQLAAGGSIPQGVSWVGAYDMSGNIWEWTNTALDDYPYNANDGREETDNLAGRRVLRGGSWGDSAQYMLGTNRGSDHPRFRDEHYGIRCARDFVSGDLE